MAEHNDEYIEIKKIGKSWSLRHHKKSGAMEVLAEFPNGAMQRSLLLGAASTATVYRARRKLVLTDLFLDDLVRLESAALETGELRLLNAAKETMQLLLNTPTKETT